MVRLRCILCALVENTSMELIKTMKDFIQFCLFNSSCIVKYRSFRIALCIPLSYLQSEIGSNSSKFVWRSGASCAFADSSLMNLKNDHEPKCKHAQFNGKEYSILILIMWFVGCTTVFLFRFAISYHFAIRHPLFAIRYSYWHPIRFVCSVYSNLLMRNSHVHIS